MLLLFVLIWCFVGPVQSNSPSDAPPVKLFLRRTGHTVTVLGDYLYIDGGEVSQLLDTESNHTALAAVNGTLSLSLNEPWTNLSASLKQTFKPAPIFRSSNIWTDPVEEVFYMWGGQAPGGNLTRTRELWQFAADKKGGGNWSAVTPANPDVFVGLRRGACSSWATCNGLGVALGGFGWVWTDPAFSDSNDSSKGVPIPGLLSYNISTRMWANESAKAFNGLGTSQKGSAACVPSAGTEGVGLILPLGGLFSDLVVFEQDTTSTNDLGNLTFYDIASKTWHSQTASGQIPPGRESFCVVGVQGENNTFEIYLYGGYSPIYKRTYGDIYALSLPGFVWFKLNPSREFFRSKHGCALGGKSQLIIVGGSDPGPDWPLGWYDPDPWPQGLAIFDLETLDWSERYRPNASQYKTPRLIEGWYHSGQYFSSQQWLWNRSGAVSSISADASPKP
ncbi:hypothetical protein HD806DRAFT_547359 [Xylariaceae sp. AK1471]|nr:hypothetical protein HD806DRAFT_547359 [Xylariaceae sp. AK1471]